MKLLLVILAAAACSAYAMPERLERLKREIDNDHQLRNTCPGKCAEQVFAHLVPTGGQQVAGQGFLVGVRPASISPNAINLDLLCADVQKLQTCVGKCDKPEDGEVKRKAEAILVPLKDLTCCPELKVSTECMKKVNHETEVVPSAACQPCLEQLQHLMETINQMPNNSATTTWEDARVIATSTCKYSSCFLKCAKPVILQKCQEAGFQAVVTVTKKTANLWQVAHAQFRPPANFPNECKPDVLVAGV